jgi:hypothetical protein
MCRILPCRDKKTGFINWELPSAFNMEKLLQELEKRPDLKHQAKGTDRNRNLNRVADPIELALICVAGIYLNFWIGICMDPAFNRIAESESESSC